MRIWVKDGNRYREIDNGPFPITQEQLDQARADFAEEFAKAAPLTGAKIAPQTTARDILAKVAPHLSALDKAMLGFAVTNTKIRTEC